WHGFRDSSERARRLGQLFEYRLDFLLKHAFELVRADLAHGHEPEVVDDEMQELGLRQDERIALEQLALVGCLDVRIECLETACSKLQQLVHQQEQLPLELEGGCLALHHRTNLQPHLCKHVARIAEHDRAEASAEDDEQLHRLPDDGP